MLFEFEDQNNSRIKNNAYQSKYSPLTFFLIRHKIVKKESTANILLLIMSGILIVASIGLSIFYVKKDSSKSNSQYKLSKEVLSKLPIEIQKKINK